MPLACLILTLCGLLLARQIRTQARTQIERFAAAALHVDVVEVESDGPPSLPPRRGSYVDTARRGSVTPSVLRKLAVMKHADGEVDSNGLEQASMEAQKILEMLKAESDLVTVSCPALDLSSALTSPPCRIVSL